MTLGYRGEPQWRDMSEYVVHFAKDTPDKSAYSIMLSILAAGRLEARNRFGAARSINAVKGQHAVCFSEVPLDLLDRLVHRRGTKYGVGFRQDQLLAAGGGRVWYVDKHTAPADAVHAMVQDALGPPFQAEHPVWRLTPFIDFPGDYGRTQYRFEWEREWRVPCDLAFQPADVAFLFIPEELHKQARQFFVTARVENLGPSYECPFLDPLWPDARIQEELASV